MTDIIINDKRKDILIKDCLDFIPLDDGTKTGDFKYCNLSFQCRQVGMAADRFEGYNDNGELIEVDYLCTGKYAKWEERNKDEEAE
jgi:hypothetical protein